MTFGDGSTKTFNSSGYLTKTKDANGNTITITYKNNRITTVTDGGGLSVELKYNLNNNKLIEIIDAAGRITHYNYNANGQLSEITYPDSSKTIYEYDNDSGLISKITAYDNMQATLSYKKFGDAYKVISYSTFGNNPTHNLYDTISFEYRTNDTVISNTKEDVLILAFDNSGRVINCILNNKTISVSQYKNATNNKNGFNNISFASQSITPKPNLTDQMPITKYVASTGGDYAVAETSFDVLYNESTSLKYGFSEGASPGSYYRFTELPLEGNKTYSFSAYVNIENTLSAGSVYMKVEAKNENGEIISTIYSERLTTTDNQWKMLSATINTPAETTSCKISYGIFDGVGIFYSESLYAEESEVISNYNFIDGSSFSSDWEHSPFHRWFGSFDNVSATTNSLDGSRALMISGNPRAQRYVYQALAINGKANDVLVYGGSAKALCSASGNNNGDSDRFFGIRLKLYNDGTLVQNSYVQFNEEAMDTFQTVMSSMVAQQDYTLYRIELCYNYEINSAVFDDIFLYRTPYGTYYEYDSNGRIKTVSDDNGNKTEAQYSGIDIVGVTSTANGATTQAATYTYDNKHNLKTAVGMDGVETSYTYNSKGLPTSVTVSDSSGLSSTTTYNYTNDNNFLESVTDPAGSITQYEYDTAKGLVTKVTDPNGNETVYEYDPDNDNLLSVSNPSAELENPSTTFEYDPASNYEAIYNDEIGYYFFNDSFGRLEVINSMDSSYYWVNEYNEDGNIDFQCIGYYDWADYTYNDDGRLTSESYNDTLYYEYAYTNSGKLGRFTDHDNNVVWDYQYDLAGRTTNAFSNDGKKVSYEYTEKNELGEILVAEDSSVMLDTRYSYDQYGRPSSVETASMSGSPTQSYSYDTLGRTNKISNEYSSASKVEQNISYVVNGSNQTGRIDTVSYQKNISGTVTNIIPSLSYDYDANGNITHIYENGTLKIRYYYDGLNRLSREDNSDIDKTVVYNYDRFGNILSKVEYALTFGELGTAINNIPYEYKSNYDAVTKYKNETMSYDIDGTAVRYRGYSMEWFKGSQLKNLSGNGITMSFKYDNNGIRTKKTVNDAETEYFYVGDTLVSQKTGNEVINFAYTAGGAPYGFTYNGTSYFYLTNIQSDIIGIYDSNGNVVVEYTYDTWGKLISITGSLASTIGVKNPLRYRGYYYDTETSLYYLQARYYDPDTGRFISPDALLVAGNDCIQGMNRYAYCYNNPVMYVDLYGNYPDIIIDMYVAFTSMFLSLFLNVDNEKLSAWIYCNKFLEEIGLNIYEGEIISISVSTKPSGVKYALINIEGKLEENGQREKISIPIYYGTGKNWLYEYQDYYHDNFPWMDVAWFVVGSIPHVGDVMSAFEIYTSLFVKDPYVEGINDIYSKIVDSEDLSSTYYFIPYIYTPRGNVYLYTEGVL